MLRVLLIRWKESELPDHSATRNTNHSPGATRAARPTSPIPLRPKKPLTPIP